MTATKVRLGEILAGVGGVALLAVTFAPWYHFLEGVYPGSRTIEAGHETQTAWQAFSALDIVLVLLALVGIALLVTTLFERTPALAVAAEVWGTVLAVITTIWVAIRVVNPPGPNYAADLKWGAWVGLVCCVAITVGCWRAMRDEVRP